MKNSLLPSILDSRKDFVSSFDRIFDTMMNESFPSFGKDFGVDFFGKSSYPKVNVVDTETAIEITAEIPGLTKEDVEIKVENGNVLSIHGHKNLDKFKSDLDEENERMKGRKYIIRELSHSSFIRKFILGDNLDTANITVLDISIPKLDKKPDNTIRINVK